MKNQRRSNQPRSILFISDLDLYSMGQNKEAPSLWYTVELLRNDKKRIELGKNAKKFANENLLAWQGRINAEISFVRELLENNDK